MIGDPPRVSGARVDLRPLDHADLDFCWRFVNDPDLRRWLRFERPWTRAQEEAWLEGVLQRPDGHYFAIERRDDHRTIGVLSLAPWSTAARTAELGVGILDPADRGQGRGEDAIATALRHGFLTMGLQRIHLHVLEGNPAARLYARLGFREEGRLRRHAYKAGALHDAICMGLLREEWSP